MTAVGLPLPLFGHPVKVSAASARLRFQGCSPDYIREVCHGACCHTSVVPQGTILRVEPDQGAVLAARGATVIDGIVQTVNRRCIFMEKPTGLCTLHGTGDKPRNCIQSPWMLNRADTLIVRNRYKMLRCYRAAPALPAYHAFRSGLDLLFGQAQAQVMVDHFERGGGDFGALMPDDRYRFLKEVRHTWQNPPPT